MPNVATMARRHWFVALLPLCFALSWSMARATDWRAEAGVAEAALLIDWCLFLPAVYAWSLKGRVPARMVALRALGLSAAGLWVAGFLMPDGVGVVLPRLGWLRWAEMAVVVAVELAILATLIRGIAAGRTDAKSLERAGAPPPLAKLMELELRFWRWVWARLRGR